MTSRAFPARYSGRCGACDERIHEGDPIRYGSDDRVVHADCEAAAPVERAPRPMCPKCFTEVPVTGVCGVCE